MRNLLSSSVIVALLAGCTSVTSETLNNAQIEAIQDRVEERYPNLFSSQQTAITELVVRAVDNMVFVEGGSFMMGEFGVPCEPGSKDFCKVDIWPDNDYAHKVTLNDFYLSKYETTLGDFDLYREVLGKEPYAQELRTRNDRKHLFQPELPAWTREWQEVKDYCLWVGELAGSPIDLPTEAQWEFAARNRGRNILYATDNGKIKEGINTPDATQREDGMMPVGSFPPNPLGIHDLTSNSAEWVNDWYSESYYKESPENNPTGPASGNTKVVRTGSRYSTPKASTSILRDSRPPQEPHYYEALGFRCAMN